MYDLVAPVGLPRGQGQRQGLGCVRCPPDHGVARYDRSFAERESAGSLVVGAPAESPQRSPVCRLVPRFAATRRHAVASVEGVDSAYAAAECSRSGPIPDRRPGSALSICRASFLNSGGRGRSRRFSPRPDTARWRVFPASDGLEAVEAVLLNRRLCLTSARRRASNVASSRMSTFPWGGLRLTSDSLRKLLRM